MEKIQYVPTLEVHEHNDHLLLPHLGIPILTAKNFAMQFLKSGRPDDYDYRHSQAVDYYATLLARHEQVDELVLRTCAWLHDTGYSDVYRNPGEYGDYVKEMHMFFSAKHAIDFFNLPDIASYYTQEQMERILYIIGVHDDLRSVYEKDAITFMEVDVLGGLATKSFVFNTYDSARLYADRRLSPRVKVFRSDLARNLATILLPKFEDATGVKVDRWKD